MSEITNEIEKRRTFAIISHPDAGKTTLTEKFLLYGGAINQAGSVKEKPLQGMQCQTGWKLRKKEEFLLPLQYYSLIMAVSVSIFWTPLDIRISQRIRTVP